jgi:hypothetical protein
MPTFPFLPVMKSSACADKVLFDFSTDSVIADWQVVNDGVMGGLSRSSFQIANGLAIFHGVVSLENNGGFASVRSQPGRFNLIGCDAFFVRARGDGRSYKFTARTSLSFDSAIYQRVFKTRKDDWQEYHLPMSEFVPTFRGRVLSDQPPLNPKQIASVGFLISERQAGAFRLEIASIKAGCLPPSP